MIANIIYNDDMNMNPMQGYKLLLFILDGTWIYGT